MFDGPAPHIFSIESGTPFVDSLADHLLVLAADDRLVLAEMRILLPTRRACRALQDAFLRIAGQQPILLPRMTPLGDMDEEELTIAESGIPAGAAAAGDLPPVIPGLKRQLLLARAILAMPDHALQPEQATALALELAKLIDRLATEQCDPTALRGLVGEDYAEHWQKVLKFLNILIDVWPAILGDEGALDPAARRNALLAAQTRVWRESPPDYPVIAAGSTGSIPATATLLAAIAVLPKGAVVLPGLDTKLSEVAWQALGMTHPQFGLRQLLRRLEINRDAVRPWPGSGSETGYNRARLLADALLPAKIEAPVPDAATLAPALDGLTRLDCPGPNQEATVIALIMRRTLETPGKTCALITPDRELARRVAASLKRWDIDIDDSAGVPVQQSPAGSFLRLVADAAQNRLAPVPLLALLKHPLAAGGMATADFRALVRILELEALRGPRPGPGIDGLKTALQGSKKHALVTPLLRIVEAALVPLAKLFDAERGTYADILSTHIACAENLAADNEQPGAARLWAGDDGDTAAHFVSELATTINTLPALPPSQYPGVFEGLLSGRVVRPRFGKHPRLFIWGLLEARLQHADTVILGGLNEGTWPPTPETNPWMSRPMMADVGLEAPERRTGLTAHDFQQAFAAPEVYITRAERVGGAPTVPSRWLLRLDNLLRRAGLKDVLKPRPGEDWLAWAEALDRAERTSVAPPRPTPPSAARPKRLSVTQVETLIRDPYSIYARHILGLKVLDPIDADPGAADRGNIVHDALKAFIKQYPGDIPDDAERRLLEIGQDAFADHLARPGVRAFWWPRFERIATWFVGWHQSRLAEGWEVRFAEEFGGINIDAVEGGFEIFAKPDRIDYRADLGLSIIDYKTGSPPSAKQVAAGLSPQLPLEAIIAAAGKFKGVPPEAAEQLMYVHLSGGRVPGQEKLLKLDVAEIVEKTMAGVSRKLVAFADPTTPYLSRPRPQFESRFGDYDHLARLAEWGGGPGDDE